MWIGKKKERRKKLERGLKQGSERRRGVISLASAMLLALSQLSYCDCNASKNWLGLVGHVIAWCGLYLFGLASWLLPVFCGWFGWRNLVQKKVLSFPIKLLYGFAILFSLAILLAMVAQHCPSLASSIKQWVYSDYYPRGTSYNPSNLRHYLGGVPLHHIYKDFFDQPPSPPSRDCYFSPFFIFTLHLHNLIDPLSHCESDRVHSQWGAKTGKRNRSLFNCHFDKAPFQTSLWGIDSI